MTRARLRFPCTLTNLEICASTELCQSQWARVGLRGRWVATWTVASELFVAAHVSRALPVEPFSLVCGSPVPNWILLLQVSVAPKRLTLLLEMLSTDACRLPLVSIPVASHFCSCRFNCRARYNRASDSRSLWRSMSARGNSCNASLSFHFHSRVRFLGLHLSHPTVVISVFVRMQDFLLCM